MAITLLRWKQEEEDIMNCLQYESVGTIGPCREAQFDARQIRRFLVLNGRDCFVDEVAFRVAEVLNFVLARGSMPT
jgi:hypothetical protein